MRQMPLRGFRYLPAGRYCSSLNNVSQEGSVWVYMGYMGETPELPGRNIGGTNKQLRYNSGTAWNSTIVGIGVLEQIEAFSLCV